MKKIIGLAPMGFFAFCGVYFLCNALVIFKSKGVSLSSVLGMAFALFSLVAGWFCYRTTFPKKYGQQEEDVLLLLQAIEELIARNKAIFCEGMAGDLIEKQKELNKRILRGEKDLANEEFPSIKEAQCAIGMCVQALDIIEQLIVQAELRIGGYKDISRRRRIYFNKRVARYKNELRVIRVAAEKYK
ncbi:MAG: hypothetical protein Q8L10_05625 [Candidatus Moranbacteria bacterium]|nr:hypothetical protein [Candidatus Moranbacteria bacterium]